MRRLLTTTVLTAILVLGVLAVGGAPPAEPEAPTMPENLPIDEPLHYIVKFLGITCGHMTLESRLETRAERDVVHIVFTARNSRFFNRIYKVDARIDSWVDVATMSSLEYLSVVHEKEEEKVERYVIDAEGGTIRAEKNGEVRTLDYDGEPTLDPLAFTYAVRAKASDPGESFELRMHTDDGPLETVSQVTLLKRKRTMDGRRELLRVQPNPADGEMFSRKGEFVMWVDPAPERTLYRLDFKLGFGRLVAALEGVDESVFDDEP